MSSISKSNAENPQAPEYGKGYKIENNSGCPCKVTIPKLDSCTTRIQRFTRTDNSIDLIELTICSDCGNLIISTCTPATIDISPCVTL
jgi:hypothetical protein